MRGSLREWIALGILTFFALMCGGIIIFDEVTGHTVDSTILGVLGFIIGILGHQLGNQQGSAQAVTAYRNGQNGGGSGG